MMEIDIHEEIDGSAGRTNENDLCIRRVAPDESGEGLPYAPIDWPYRGDTWGWKVGKRVSSTGYFHDRYLYVPKSLRHGWAKNSSRRKYAFDSKLAVERYLKTLFPDKDLRTFFASFTWKIPAKISLLPNGAVNLKCVPAVPHIPYFAEIEESDSQSDGLCCKARNNLCISLLKKEESPPIAFMECNICCTEAKFCRDCCCILCLKTINFSYGGYDYIRCEALTGDAVICGHAAHIDCALRCYLAGTIGGSIGLDSEYYCRLCDARTDLVPHVMRLLHACESLDSQDNIEKILNIGICILRSSKKNIAKELLKHIEVALAKLKSGTSLEDIWKQEDGSHHESAAMEVTTNKEPLDSKQTTDLLSASCDYCFQSQKLAEDIDQALHALKKSQETEYKGEAD